MTWLSLMQARYCVWKTKEPNFCLSRESNPMDVLVRQEQLHVVHGPESRREKVQRPVWTASLAGSNLAARAGAISDSLGA